VQDSLDGRRKYLRQLMYRCYGDTHERWDLAQARLESITTAEEVEDHIRVLEAAGFGDPRFVRSRKGWVIQGMAEEIRPDRQMFAVLPDGSSAAIKIISVGKAWRPNEHVTPQRYGYIEPFPKCHHVTWALEKAQGGGKVEFAPPEDPRAKANQKATPAQVDEAERLVRARWHDSDIGQGFHPPARHELERMTQWEIGMLIRELRGQ